MRTTTGVAHGKSIPFLPILDFYRDSFNITAGDDALSARQKVAGALVLLDDELRDSFPLLFDFLGIAPPDAEAITPDQQQQLTALLQRITLARSEVEPAVLVFEDLHWFDSGSEALLAGLIDSLAGTRTLLIANYRPEYRGDWMHRSHVQQIALQPLSADAIDKLLAGQVGADPSLDELRPQILERTAGNPFFIEEVVRSLAEQGALAGARGSYRLSQPLAEVRIPLAVQNVLAARMDRLPGEQKTVLQTASVVGADFSETLLSRVAEVTSEALATTLASLVSSEFLYERAIYPEREYAFRHPLTREVAYASQLQSRRAETHAAVAQALEAAHPEQIDEKAAVLAQHWEDAGNALYAMRWHRRAAEWVGLGNPRESVHHFERVRALGNSLPAGTEADQPGLLARVQILAAVGRMGADPEHVEEIYREAQVLLDRLDAPSAHVQLLSAYGLCFIHSGDLVSGTTQLERALELADQGGDLNARVAVRYSLNLALTMTGQNESVIRLADEALELLEGDPELGSTELGFPSLAAMRFMKTSALVILERFAEAERTMEKMQRVARERVHPISSYFSASAESLVCGHAGHERRALAAAVEAVTLSERTSNLVFISGAMRVLALAHEANGHHEEALREARRAVERGHDGNRRQAAMSRSTLAKILVVDDPASARRIATEALSDLAPGGRYSRRTELVTVLANLKLKGPAARPTLEARLERLEAKYGADSVLARAEIEEVRAAVAAAANDGPANETHLRRAQTLYAEADAAGHATRLSRELDGS